MSLNKAIKSGKEHRKPFRGSEAFDQTCRSHGGCPYCDNNRKHKVKRQNIKSLLNEDYNY